MYTSINDYEAAPACGFKITLKIAKLALILILKFWYHPLNEMNVCETDYNTISYK